MPVPLNEESQGGSFTRDPGLCDAFLMLFSRKRLILIIKTSCAASFRVLNYYFFSIYTGVPVVGTPILGTHYIVSCDAEVCGAERESSRTIQGRMH